MSACLHDTRRDNIFIGGFMCSGKTSVGSELARRLGWTFTDTDRVIEERAGMTVPEIFSTLGEPAFRRYEFAAVAGALEGSRQVVSLGGGALVNEELRGMILSRAKLVILDVRPETVLSRAEKQKGARPLLDGGNVRALMIKRRPAYAHCHIRVATDEFPVSSVTDRILEDLYGTAAVLWSVESPFPGITGRDRSPAAAGRPSVPSWYREPSGPVHPQGILPRR
jgi:shikimate kinase